MSEKQRTSKARSSSGVQALAHWVLSIDSASVPAAAITQAKLLLLDTIGCAIAGRDEDVCRAIVAVCEQSGSGGPCTIIGRSHKVDIGHAVLANGALVRVLDLNDYVVGAGKSGPEIGGHPSDNIAVALAVGEARGQSGRHILAAIAVGYEIYGRFKGLMDRKGPWDGVSVSGFVAPAIAGRLMGLDEDRLAHALALSGVRAAIPALVRRGDISAAKSIANALVAQNGVEATLLAEQGVTGPLAIIEHERGLQSVFPKGDAISALTTPLPAESYIMRSHVKAYPCLATGQAAVTAALKLRQTLGGAFDGLAHIEVIMADYPFVRDQQHDPGRIHPHSRESADHSFQFLVAVALTDGVFGPAQFECERWHDPAIIALMDRIVMGTDSTLNARAPGTYPCIIRAHDTSGGEHSVEVLFPPGYSRDGIEEAEIVDKFHAVTARTIERDRRNSIISAVLNFDRAATTDALIATISA
jgi:2-methylcitrate dehydratase